jgi:hypothetical protein
LQSETNKNGPKIRIKLQIAMDIREKKLLVDVIQHPKYSWILDAPDTERLLGVSRSVVSMNKSNNPSRYRRGIHYVFASDLFDFLVENQGYNFRVARNKVLWTREGVLELSKRVWGVRPDFLEIIDLIDKKTIGD